MKYRLSYYNCEKDECNFLNKFFQWRETFLGQNFQISVCKCLKFTLLTHTTVRHITLNVRTQRDHSQSLIIVVWWKKKKKNIISYLVLGYIDDYITQSNLQILCFIVCVVKSFRTALLISHRRRSCCRNKTISSFKRRKDFLT